MFGIGGTEIILILLVALLVFGPENLPQLAGKIARVIREVRRAGEEVRMHVDPDGEIYRATHFPPIPPLPSSYHDNAGTEKRDDAKEDAGDEADHSAGAGADSGEKGEAGDVPPPDSPPGSGGVKKN